MGQYFRILIAVSIPIFVIIYGSGDYIGWWDIHTGRRAALVALEKLSTAKGVPDILLYNDQVGFRLLWKLILRESENEYLRELAKQGKQPNCIVRIGMAEKPAIGTEIPSNMPVSGHSPVTTPLLAVYGYAKYPAKDAESPGEARYACTLGDLRKWINDHRNRERFIFTIVLIGILSIVVILLDVSKKKDRQPQSSQAKMEVMNKEEYLKAKIFIFSDIEREIQLARADPKSLQALNITPGGGNFLATLALLCYTEFGGKLRFGFKRLNGSDIASDNFNEFFDLLGPEYKSFREKHNVYDIFRCGLAHEFYVKESCTICMLAEQDGSGIGV